MEYQAYKRRRFFFACLGCLDTWTDGALDSNLSPTSLATVADQYVGKLEALGADGRPALRTIGQHAADRRDQDAYRASAFRARMNTQKNRTILRATVAATVGVDEQGSLSQLQNILSSVVRDAMFYCSFSSFTSSFRINI